jgi:hypothetical protein
MFDFVEACKPNIGRDGAIVASFFFIVKNDRIPVVDASYSR